MPPEMNQADNNQINDSLPTDNNANSSNQELPETKQTKSESDAPNMDALMKEIKTLRAQNRELLGEKKTAKQAAEQAEIDKAKASGEYKKWAESAEKAAKDWEAKYNEKVAEIKNEKLENQAASIANELAANDKASKLLKTLIKESLSSLADENGVISKEDLESFKREVKNGEDYAPLVAGSKSSGSGAPGAGSSASGVREISMADWEKMSPEAQLEFSNLSRAGKAHII